MASIRESALASKHQLLYFLPLAAAMLWFLDVPYLRFIPAVLSFYLVHGTKITFFLVPGWTAAGVAVLLPACWVAQSAVAGAPASLGDAMAIAVSLVPVEICAVYAVVFTRLIVTRHAPTIADKAIIRLFWDPGYMAAIWTAHRLKGGRGWSVSIINDGVAMSGMPFADCVPKLVEANVKSVVNMCAEWPGPVREYQAAGIVQERFPTVDTCPASLDDLEKVAAFVRDRRAAEPGSRVLFHCKGGRARAATAAVAAMVDGGSTAEAAMHLIKEKRPVVETSVLRLSTLKAFVAKRAHSD